MLYRVLSIAGTALWLLMLPTSAFICAASAQSGPAKAVDKNAPPAHQPAEPSDAYVEAQRVLGSPAGNPECVWTGRRVVSLLWRDDLETAFRHLALYDRFGCPGAHVQAAFRCLILHADSIDPKAPDSLNGRVAACWLDPAQPAPAAAASSAAPAKTTKR